jgi:hypothetical protein
MQPSHHTPSAGSDGNGLVTSSAYYAPYGFFVLLSTLPFAMPNVWVPAAP